MIAIDLGSNTLRIVEYDGDVWGKSFEKIVHTAEGIHTTGIINDAALKRIINALNDARRWIDFSHHDCIAITTAAMRMAKNSDECLQQIAMETGISFRIIDGEEEAMLTLRAVSNRLNILNRLTSEWVLVDIGGGSTEVVVISDNRIESKSFPIGIVTLSEKAERVDDLTGELKFFRDTIVCYIASLHLSCSPETLVLTAGTPTTVAAYLMGMDYHSYDSVKINGAYLAKVDCARVLSELLAMDESTRARFVGVGRETLIVVGIQILEMIFDAFSLNNAIVIDDGLREGIALNYYFQNQIPNLT